jgi:hypothetical protein
VAVGAPSSTIRSSATETLLQTVSVAKRRGASDRDFASVAEGRSTKKPVIAFEPLLTHAALAVHNARINGPPISVLSAAVANTDGWVAFARRERKLDKL